jgi:hypothetical protein
VPANVHVRVTITLWRLPHLPKKSSTPPMAARKDVSVGPLSDTRTASCQQDSAPIERVLWLTSAKDMPQMIGWYSSGMNVMLTCGHSRRCIVTQHHQAHITQDHSTTHFVIVCHPTTREPLCHLAVDTTTKLPTGGRGISPWLLHSLVFTTALPHCTATGGTAWYSACCLPSGLCHN